MEKEGENLSVCEPFFLGEEDFCLEELFFWEGRGTYFWRGGGRREPFWEGGNFLLVFVPDHPHCHSTALVFSL